MDAKAKVIRYGPFLADPKDDRKPWATMISKDDGGYVKLTDHEAAMAELRAGRDELLAQVDESASLAEEAVRQRDALLTGLEALAGEWEKKRRQFTVQGHAKKETYAKCAAELRTLASAGLEGK